MGCVWDIWMQLNSSESVRGVVEDKMFVQTKRKQLKKKKYLKNKSFGSER